MTKIISRKQLFFGLIIFKLSLEVVYIYQVSPTYSYLSLITDINVYKLCISYIIFFLLSMVLPINREKPSTYLINILFVLMWIPTSSYYWLSNQSTIYMLYLSFCFFILFLVRFLKLDIKIFKEEKIFIVFIFVYIFYIISNFLLIFKVGGIDVRAFNFDSIYEVRLTNRVTGVWGYILNWCSKAFFPFFTVYFIEKEKKTYLLITIFSQILLYLAYGNKAFLFSILFLFFCIFLLKKRYWTIFFPNILSVLMGLSLVFNEYRFGELIVRTIPYRLLFVPSQIQFWYYTFFTENNKLFYGESFIGNIFGTRKYGISTSLLINKYFTNIKIETNANTGIFSDAFANGGLIAMIITAIVLLYILILIDSFAKKISVSLLVPAFSYSMFIMNDTSLLISLNTGGILLLLLLFYCYNPKKIEVM